MLTNYYYIYTVQHKIPHIVLWSEEMDFNYGGWGIARQ